LIKILKRQNASGFELAVLGAVRHGNPIFGGREFHDEDVAGD